MMGKLLFSIMIGLVLTALALVLFDIDRGLWFLAGSVVFAAIVFGYMFFNMKNKPRKGGFRKWRLCVASAFLFVLPSLCVPIFATTQTVPILTDRSFSMSVDEDGCAVVSLLFDFKLNGEGSTSVNSSIGSVAIYADFDNLYNGTRLKTVTVNATKLYLDDELVWNKTFTEEGVVGFSLSENVSLVGDAHQGTLIIAGMAAEEFRGQISLWITYEYTPASSNGQDGNGDNGRTFWWDNISVDWWWSVPIIIGGGVTALFLIRRKRKES